MTEAKQPDHDEHRLAQRVYCAKCGEERPLKGKWDKPCDGGAAKRARRAATWGQTHDGGRV